MQRGLPGLRDEERFGPWVYQVARSAIADQQRTAARHPLVVEPPPEPEAPAVEAPPVEAPEGDDSARLLASSLAMFVAALPSPYREALTLTELEGMSQKDSAEMLGLSLSGMKSRVQRGRVVLRGSVCLSRTETQPGVVSAWERHPIELWEVSEEGVSPPTAQPGDTEMLIGARTRSRTAAAPTPPRGGSTSPSAGGTEVGSRPLGIGPAGIGSRHRHLASSANR